jgi:hypothetical protein
MAANLLKCQRILRNTLPTKRLLVIFNWIRDKHIDYNRYRELLLYMERIEDILDAEFTEARLKEIKERKNGESVETPQV